jgi:hypothetical protein
MKIEIFNFVKRRWEQSDFPEIETIEEEQNFVRSLGDNANDYYSSLVQIINVMAQMKEKTTNMEKS